MCRSQYYYVSKKDDSAVISALGDLSAKHPVYGFRKLYAYLRRAGKPWNHKKVYRVYKLLNMNKKRVANVVYLLGRNSLWNNRSALIKNGAWTL